MSLYDSPATVTSIIELSEPSVLVAVQLYSPESLTAIYFISSSASLGISMLRIESWKKAWGELRNQSYR